MNKEKKRKERIIRGEVKTVLIYRTEVTLTQLVPGLLKSRWKQLEEEAGMFRDSSCFLYKECSDFFLENLQWWRFSCENCREYQLRYNKAG